MQHLGDGIPVEELEMSLKRNCAYLNCCNDRNLMVNRILIALQENTTPFSFAMKEKSMHLVKDGAANLDLVINLQVHYQKGEYIKHFQRWSLRLVLISITLI